MRFTREAGSLPTDASPPVAIPAEVTAPPRELAWLDPGFGSLRLGPPAEPPLGDKGPVLLRPPLDFMIAVDEAVL